MEQVIDKRDISSSHLSLQAEKTASSGVTGNRLEKSLSDIQNGG